MPSDHFTLDDFDFSLPAELIAQYPAEKRDESRLFVLDRNSGAYVHSGFSSLPAFLRQGDLLVYNDAKVINARIPSKRKSGGAIELLLTGRINQRRWTAITNRTSRIAAGDLMSAEKNPEIEFMIIDKTDQVIEIEANVDLDDEVLAEIGQLALPPYIKRDMTDEDRDRYQTVFARESGAVAAPTAGLHFTPELADAVSAMGVRMVPLTLFVSWGTFQPVRDRNIAAHRMHSERFMLGSDSAETINNARRNGDRIIAVGTTSVRVLESTYRDGMNMPGEGETDIFIYPPRKVTAIDSLITNFHTPRSTLLMLVAAFAGYDVIMDAYREAIRQRYRFFSYGDSMLIL
ncbi:MAG TPA: tRNA preQ1(34) S-adenosylmethionine ribosyltransferase-isomerase QueA [Spirochaetota bacterium]|nr:tRNA preQ1(34) S-adenosylmethionine ribosyltransferase-isomerase QueA [Spirochaetota bacterium]HQH96273.1 tRNA preQ1(34) S-adenosylmethionine ribosyltransferase-isomerase QueA [Spirochaetota bacterium]